MAMRNYRKEFRDVADQDPPTALIVLLVMAGVLVAGLTISGVLYGSYTFLWWVWFVKAGVMLVVLGIEWVIWTVVAKTYGV